MFSLLLFVVVQFVFEVCRGGLMHSLSIEFHFVWQSRNLNKRILRINNSESNETQLRIASGIFSLWTWRTSPPDPSSSSVSSSNGTVNSIKSDLYFTLSSKVNHLLNYGRKQKNNTFQLSKHLKRIFLSRCEIIDRSFYFFFRSILFDMFNHISINRYIVRLNRWII